MFEFAEIGESGVQGSLSTTHLDIYCGGCGGVLAEVSFRALSDNATFVENENAITQLMNLGENVTRYDDGVSVTQITDDTAHLNDLNRVETIVGLIEQYDRRLMNDRVSDTNPTVKLSGVLNWQTCDDEVCDIPASDRFELSIPVEGPMAPSFRGKSDQDSPEPNAGQHFKRMIERRQG